MGTARVLLAMWFCWSPSGEGAPERGVGLLVLASVLRASIWTLGGSSMIISCNMNLLLNLSAGPNWVILSSARVGIILKLASKSRSDMSTMAGVGAG